MYKLSRTPLTQSALYLHCFFYLSLVFLVLNFNGFYHSLDYELGFLELCGAGSLLVASIILFFGSLRVKKIGGKSDKRFWMLLGASILFFWAAGEEISWGQHFFGTQTPEWLAKVNDQNETNLHNINKKFFDRYLERLTFLLAFVTAILHFRGKEFFLGLKMPEYPLNMAFILVPIYRKLQSVHGHDIWPVGFLIFLGYPIVGIIKKDVRILLNSLLFILTTAIVIYVHHNNIELWQGKSNIYHEVKETIFSVLCIFFSIQLYKNLHLKQDYQL
jgi:hypothetical protein